MPQWLVSVEVHSRVKIFSKRRRDVARPSPQAHSFEQPAQIASCALIKVEIKRSGLACERELAFKTFQFDRECGRAPNDGPLGGGRIVDPSEIGDMLGDQVLGAPDPGASTVDAREQRRPVGHPGTLGRPSADGRGPSAGMAVDFFVGGSRGMRGLPNATP